MLRGLLSMIHCFPIILLKEALSDGMKAISGKIFVENEQPSIQNTNNHVKSFP